MQSNRIAEVNEIQTYVRELMFLNNGIRKPQYSASTGAAATKSSDDAIMREKMTSSINAVESLTIDI